MSASASSCNPKAAQGFLDKLKNHLNATVRSRGEVKRRVREAVAAAKESKNKKDKSCAFPEGAFLNVFVIPAIYEFLTAIMEPKLSRDEARRSLLSESYRNHPTMALASPASLLKHPFTKVLDTSAMAVSRRWRDKTAEKSCVSQSCPDLALRSPHKIVFEAKYFNDGGVEAAKTALVTGIYQSFYYLGLPSVAEDKHHAAWDYDFSCFLIYDGSENASVLSAWSDVGGGVDIGKDVKDGCWNGANIFVMVLRGNDD